LMLYWKKPSTCPSRVRGHLNRIIGPKE